jgi:phospholipid transport system substrate-binding protein
VSVLPVLAGAAEPRAVIDALHDGLTVLAAEPDQEFAERMRRLQPLLAATHDIEFIARFSLGRNWTGLDAQQQRDFVAAFERLSLATYAARFRRLEPGALETVSAEVTTATRASVRAVIHRRDAPDVPLDYVLQATEQGWRIINIVADGVSDLALKRAEYQALLTSGGFAALMAAVERQALQLEQAGFDQPTNR